MENGELQWVVEEKKAAKEQRRRKTPIAELEFGDSLRVECRPGFRSVGAETVKCLANQTLSGVRHQRSGEENWESDRRSSESEWSGDGR